MNKTFLITTFLLLLAPALAHAQAAASAEARASVRARAGSAPSASAAGGEAALRAVLRAGLPAEPVRRVIAQGEARGASRDEVGRAAMESYTRLRVSRDALAEGAERGREPATAEIVAGAEALLQGARPRDLRTVRDGAPEDRSLEAALLVLAELTARGMRSGKVAGALAAHLSAGAPDGAILAAGARSAADGTLGGGAGALGSASLGAAAGLGAGGSALSAGLGATAALGGIVR